VKRAQRTFYKNIPGKVKMRNYMLKKTLAVVHLIKNSM